MSGDSNKLVFVSYAHEDRPFLEKDLLPFLRHLALGEHIELWEDSSIGAGQDWYAEIADRLDHAKVAILLVTENFLASKFCQHEEVPVLLQRARRGQLHVMPLLVEPSVWSIERWLKRRQMRPGGEKSLKEHTATKRKKLLTAFAKEVLAAVEGAAPPSVNEVHFDQPTATHDLHRLPETGSLLFGRRRELDVLDRAWDEGTTNIVAFTAGGGVGKSTLARVWAEMLAEDGWRGAERAFAWSFYSQGTGRMTDAETFLNEALHWFGEEGEDWEGRSMWDRADLLADHLRRNRTLLVLDGVEPLQSSEKIDRGSIRDPGLKTLLEELANGHPGLCIVTTRERLADLEETAAPGVLHRDLDQVSTLAGRALLRVKRIGGEDSQLEAAVHDLGGHALAVALLGNLVTDGVESPHISGNLVLPDLRHPVDQGGHPRRVLEAWARRLGESAEQELLQLLGLFDRPAPIAAVRAVIDGNPLPGLTKRLHRADLDEVFARLRSTGLLLRESKHDSVLDAHPIVRSHHGEWARTRHPKSVREANLRLYAYYCSSSRARPERLSEVVPLIAGIGHGCAAGKHQQTFVEVFIPRLLQDDQFLWHRLGAFAPALTTLAHYFHEPWQQPHSELGSQAQRSVLASAGYCLRALGKLAAAVAPTEAVIGRAVAEQDWQSAAINCGNLSEIYLNLGRLDVAEKMARQAVAHADVSEDWFQMLGQRTYLANVLHQLGRSDEAEQLFIEAERQQSSSSPGYRHLYSVQGFWYCDLLLAERRVPEVLQRAHDALRIATMRARPLEIALDSLTLARAYMATEPTNREAAEPHLRDALSHLRKAGNEDEIPRGLLARATFHRLADDLSSAMKDLDAAQKLCRRHDLRLFEADVALERARCQLAAGERADAGATLSVARELIAAMNYGRYRSELTRLQAELAG